MEMSLLNSKKLYSKRTDELLDAIQNGLGKSQNPAQYNILHIDDNHSTLQVSKMFLEDMDSSFNLICESDPACVIDYIQDNVDCFIVDYTMPGMDGVELSKMIRRFTDKPIILFTSRECSEVPLDEMYEMDIDYIQKNGNPCVYHLLSRMIRRLVSQNSLTRSLIASLEHVVRAKT